MFVSISGLSLALLLSALTPSLSSPTPFPHKGSPAIQADYTLIERSVFRRQIDPYLVSRDLDENGALICGDNLICADGRTSVQVVALCSHDPRSGMPGPLSVVTGVFNTLMWPLRQGLYCMVHVQITFEFIRDTIAGHYSKNRWIFISKMVSQPGAVALVVSLGTLDRASLPIAGGKAGNLGELIHAGFTVPEGFCVTTAAYTLTSTEAQLEASLSELEGISHDESARQIELAIAMRTALCQTPLPPDIVEAITRAYSILSATSPCPVSVRSSATAEDLPFASFAGQQDTFLNVIGIDAVLSSVQRCFASLWNDRATQYRASLGIAPRSMRLAVVVQRMVEVEVAGVLFTANPLTGKRREIVIDANPGLGEAVVSGATNPDHFVVHTTGEIVERQLGDKQVQIQAAAEGGTRKRLANIDF